MSNFEDYFKKRKCTLLKLPSFKRKQKTNKKRSQVKSKRNIREEHTSQDYAVTAELKFIKLSGNPHEQMKCKY